MNRSWIARYPAAVAVLICLLAVSLHALAQGVDGVEEREIQPPKVLADAGVLLADSDEQQAERAGLSWQAVTERVEPSPLPKPQGPPVAGALSPDAAELLEQSRAALARGEAFDAVELLRQAEAISPGHPKVMRALGFAYAQAGNLVRGVSYLREVVAREPGDAEAWLLLARHAAQGDSIEQVLAYCDALEKAQAPALIADYYRAIGLSRLGYTTAATQRLANVLSGIKADEAPKDQDKLPERIAREWAVIKALEPQLSVQQGDLLLALGEYEHAGKAYASVGLQDTTSPHALAARRVYLALRSGDQPRAIDEALSLLIAPKATARDAQLVGYLAEQGVPREALSDRIESILDTRGVTLPRLIALSQVAGKERLITRIGGWLHDEAVDPERLRQAVGLIPLDDNAPADAKPLADLLAIVAGLMQQQPGQALAYARAAVSEIDTPVTLLRAIRSDGFVAQGDAYRQLLSAVAYEQTLRRRDAAAAYQQLIELDASLSDQVRVPLARLQLMLGRGEEALALLGEPSIESDWDRFELTVRAMAAAGRPREAVGLVGEYQSARGKDQRSDVLRIEMIAQMGSPQEACNLLLRMISGRPSDASLYQLGINLAYVHRDQFNRISDAERMRRAFLTRLISNLPDSPTARISMADNIRSNPARRDEAKRLLQAVLADEPGNLLALSLLVDLYDEAGDEDAADAAHQRYAEALGPGLSQALVIAERAVSVGEMQRASEVLLRVVELDEQGVLPGPQMTGDQASMVLRYLEASTPERDVDALYLAFVRRFPDHAGLNNALGYRWAVQGKNLLQAKTMIERALEQEPMSHSLLDSLAWVQYKLGQFEEAQATQRRALMVLEALLARFREFEQQQAATIAILNDHMGDILYQSGEQRQALEHWREAMKQRFGDEEMMFDPELRTLQARLEAKIDAMAKEVPAPVAEVPGPDAHGPEGHPADRPGQEPAPEGEKAGP